MLIKARIPSSGDGCGSPKRRKNAVHSPDGSCESQFDGFIGSGFSLVWRQRSVSRSASHGFREASCALQCDSTRSSTLLRCTSFVAVMQATNLRNLHNGSHLRRLHSAGAGRILAQRQVSTRFWVGFKVAAQNPSQVLLSQDDTVRGHVRSGKGTEPSEKSQKKSGHEPSLRVSVDRS